MKYLTLLLALVIIGCGTSPRYLDDLIPEPPTEQELCEIGGGEWMLAGLLGEYHCITPYSDAREPCTSSEECEGRCVFLGVPPESDDCVDGVCPAWVPGEPFCEEDNSVFGCYGVIEEGPAILCYE